MKIKIDHVGIAVRSLGSRLPFWSEMLGLAVGGVERVEAEGVTVAFMPVGQSSLELLEPFSESSAIARHLQRRGEGIHHLTFAVDELDATLERLRAGGVEIVGGGGRSGAGGRRVAFLHPRSTGGVLVELSQAGGGKDLRSRDEERIGPGATVLGYLREPQEKVWGVLRRLDEAGVVLEGIDLSSFDDWVSQIERDEESVVGPSVLFFPMARLERLLLDRSSGHLPSLAERFFRRTGRTVHEVLGGTAEG